MARYDLVLNMSPALGGSQLSVQMTDPDPVCGEWSPGAGLAPPLALSVLPAAGPEEPEALQLTLAEKHTSPVAQHNYFHMFVSPGRTKEQSPLFWKQKTLMSETKTEAFRNSARDTLIGFFSANRLNALKWAKYCQQIRAITHCFHKITALKVSH